MGHNGLPRKIVLTMCRADPNERKHAEATEETSNFRRDYWHVSYSFYVALSLSIFATKLFPHETSAVKSKLEL